MSAELSTQSDKFYLCSELEVNLVMCGVSKPIP